MEKNKSIDGLAPRRSKKAATTSAASKTTTPKASTSSKTTRSKTSSKTASKSTTSTTKPKTTRTTRTTKTTKATRTPKTTKSPKTTKIAKSPKTTKATVAPAPTPKTAEAAPNSTKLDHQKPTSITEDFLKPVQAFDFDEQSGELKASTTPIEKGKRMKKEKKPISKKRKIINRIVIGFLSLLIILAIIFIIWGNDILARITGGQGNVFDLLFTDETYEPLKTDENGRTNILAFGTSGYDMEGTEGDGTHDGAQLTDSIMVISLNQDTGDVAMLSLPRDLKVSTMCTSTGKINEVYWCNNMEGDDEQAGAEALMSEVSDILDVDFQYYAHLNWGSLVQIVDSLGGINVTLDEDIDDYYYTGAIFEAGTEYTINGGQALGLARARHGTESGDFSRGASQQKILIGIKNKLSEKQFSIPELINLASTLGDNLRTNFSVDEIRTLAHLTSEYDFNNIRQVSLIEPENYMTTGDIGGISYVLPVGGSGNYHAIQKYIKKMFSNDPRSYEDASILVLNATEAPGIASNEKSTLEQEGYDNIYADDAPAGEYTDDYILYSLTDTAPGTKSLLEEKYHITAKSAEELPAGIPADYDFVLIINTTGSSDSES